jgi:hypothetical protein
VSELALTMDGMKRTIRRFLDISQAVAAEQNFDRCCRDCSPTRSRLRGAAAGILYLAEEAAAQAGRRARSCGRAAGGTTACVGIDHAGPLLGAALAAAWRVPPAAAPRTSQLRLAWLASCR